MMRYLFIAVFLLLALPAAAQDYDEVPDLDEDGCIELGAKLDADAAAGQEPTEYEKEQYDKCVGFLGGCGKLKYADIEAKKAEVSGTADEKESLVRFVIKTCSGYDPPKGGN